MEIGLSNDIPTYAGGLGVLAGDVIRTSADLQLPLVAVTLVCKNGYCKQRILNRDIVSRPIEWDPSKHLALQQPTVNVVLQGRDVNVKAWTCEVKGRTGGVVQTLFLDTNSVENDPNDREITSFLYGGDQKYRLKQEMILGIGGVKMLDALGYRVRKYHMNEGHCAFVALELLRRHGMRADEVRDLCAFTMHTPVEYGHDKFPYEVVKEVVGNYVPFDVLQTFGGCDEFNLTLLGLSLSGYINGVGKKHKDVSKRMFSSHKINTITNGVHSYTWTCESMRKLFDQYLPGWANDPALLARVDIIPDEAIWQAHKSAKTQLIDYVNEMTASDLDYDTFTIGFARRATAYKRANLIFSDLEQLKRVNEKGRMQLIFSGKAHIRDESGRMIIQEILDSIDKLSGEIKVVYLEDYDMEIASKLVSGVDVWLNTPLPPFEASGTSGMKAAHNGVINFSVLDGWWIEGWIENVTGWAIGPRPEKVVSNEDRWRREIDDLYHKLGYVIIPQFYGARKDWIVMMKNSIGKLAYYFNSHRMMLHYVLEAYFR